MTIELETLRAEINALRERINIYSQSSGPSHQELDRAAEKLLAFEQRIAGIERAAKLAPTKTDIDISAERAVSRAVSAAGAAANEAINAAAEVLVTEHVDLERKLEGSIGRAAAAAETAKALAASSGTSASDALLSLVHQYIHSEA